MGVSWGSRGMEEAFSHLSEGKPKGNLFQPEFWLREGEKGVLVQIIDREPFNAYVHSIERLSAKGKKYNVTKTCSGDECFYCEAAAKGIKTVSGKMFRMHLSILDSRPQPYEIDGEDYEPARWTRRLWRSSAKRLTPLISLSAVQAKGSMRALLVLISRQGSGTNTLYTFDAPGKKAIWRIPALSDEIEGWMVEDGKIGVWAPCPEFDGQPEPFDYENVLKPDTYEEAAAFMGKSTAAKEDEEEEDEEEEDEDALAADFVKRLRKKV